MDFQYVFKKNFNDPSAGSPTETLLRLLLPLNNRVCKFYNYYYLSNNIYLSNLITNVFNR